MAERPKIADQRKRVGDWQGDIVGGGKGSEYVVAHIDQKSRYLIVSKLSRKKASIMVDKTIALFLAQH